MSTRIHFSRRFQFCLVQPSCQHISPISFHHHTMPPKSPYKFTRPQHEYLKSHLELYMVALQAEDTVKEIQATIDVVYAALIKEFHLGEQAAEGKEAIRLVRYLLQYLNLNEDIYS